MKFRPDIEGLRAVAVLLVVFSHLGISGFSGGFVGVDIFFVISGYLITGLITSEFSKKESATPGAGWISLRTFYLRRVKRIIPVSFFVITCTVIAAHILLNAIRAKQVMNDAIWSALFGANIHFIRLATDYFQQGVSTSPLQHYWSLAVEEQFYLVIPALFILSANILKSRFFSGAFNWRKRVTLFFILVVLASLLWSIANTSSSPASAYFSSFTRAWELGAGALLAVLVHKQEFLLHTVVKEVLGLIGIGLFSFSTLVYSSTTEFPGFAALAPVLGAVLVIYSGHDGTTLLSRILGSPGPKWIGRISYSVYLWHWPIIVLANATHPHLLSSGLGKALFIPVVLVISFLSYKFVEQPIRQLPLPVRWKIEKAKFQPIKLLAASAVISLIAVVGILIGGNLGSHPKETIRPAPMASSPVPVSSISDSYTALLAKWQKKIVDSTFVDTVTGLNPSFEVTQSYDTWRNPDCTHQASIFGVAEIKNLAICKEGSGPKIALFIGNSHARMWQRAVTQPFVKSGWTIYSFFMPWCMIPNLNGIDHKFDKVYDCDLYHNDLKVLLEKMKPSVVVVSERLFPTMSFRAGGKIYPENTNEALFWQLYQAELASIKAVTPKVIVLGVTPELPRTISDCVDAQGKLDLMCQADGAGISQKVASQSKAALGAGALFIDTRDWLCYKQVACPAIIGNTMVYKDLDHTSYPIESKLSLLLGAYLRGNGIL